MLAFHRRAVIKYHTLAIETHEEVKYLPNIKSAEKRVLVGERNNLRNRIVKSGVKSALKKFDVAATAGQADAKELFVKAASAVDKAASKGVIHKNAANRKKAQLAKKMSKA
jgi:small subunit ribosomal protein S20